MQFIQMKWNIVPIKCSQLISESLKQISHPKILIDK